MREVEVRSLHGHSRSRRAMVLCRTPARQRRTWSHFAADRKRVNKTEDVVKVGDTIEVKVIGIDEKGRVKLSHKALLLPEPEDNTLKNITPGRPR